MEPTRKALEETPKSIPAAGLTWRELLNAFHGGAQIAISEAERALDESGIGEIDCQSIDSHLAVATRLNLLLMDAQEALSEADGESIREGEPEEVN